MLDGASVETLSRRKLFVRSMEEWMMSPHARHVAMIFTASALLGLAGCGADQPAPKTEQAVAPAPTAAPTSRLPAQAPNSPTASAVRISDEIVKACGISEPDAYFAFDSSNVRPDDARVVDQVVKCFTNGPLKGRQLKLVGHADPRGGSDYNMTLGQSRADSVAGYMVGHGMDKSKTESTSRGAMDATGTDEPSWARDRRVDLMLGQ
jgi:peptidoglycan-associated lipoprotein